MANHQSAATLGVQLSLETGNFVTEANKVAYETQKMKNAIAREMRAADKEIQTLKYATEDYGKAVSKVTLLERELATGRLKNLGQSDSGKQKVAELLQQAAAYDKITAAQKKMTNVMTEQQKLQLTYQTTDLFTQLASGQNPMIALIQQGGQLKDSMGGMGNMFRLLLAAINPVTVALVAVGVAAAATATAFYQAAEELKKFRNDMALTGQFAGIAYDEFIKMGDALSHVAHTSIGEARDALTALVASGQFTRDTLDSVSKVVIKFGQLSGLSAKEAAGKLIPSLDGSAASAKRLNDTYHFLSLEQYKQIEILEKQGKQQEAVRLTADLLSQSFAKTSRDLGYLESAWKTIKEVSSSAWDAMMGWGREAGVDKALVLQEKINKMTTWLETRAKQFPNADLSSQRKMLDSMKAELAGITERVGAEMDSANAASKKAEEEAKRIKDYAENKDARTQKRSDLAKATAEAEYATAVRSANEIERANLEIGKKAAEAYAEMREKNEKEFGKFSVENAAIYQQKIIQIAEEGAAKITEIKSKARAAEIEAQNAEEQRLKDMNTAFAQMQATAKQNALDKTDSLQMDKENLMLKNQMLYATEKEIKLAEIALKYERERKKPLADLEELKQQEAIDRFNVELQDSMKKNAEVFDTVWGNMGSAIDNFVKTGKLSMKDLTRSIIQDLIAIQMKAVALSFLRMMFGGNPLAQSSYSSSGGMIEHVFNPAGKASGGPVSGNTPYLVGEQGPELFMPSGSGTIIPNGPTSQMGGVTNVTNNYINAIDTKSFEDRLLGSHNAIWAANQYANKSLAVNRGRA